MKLAFVTTHPIQYHSHWFRALADTRGLDFEVLYCHQPSSAEQGRAGFGVAFDWDVPLFQGYRYEFLRNDAPSPGLEPFGGLDNREIVERVSRKRYDVVVVNGWHYRTAVRAIRACWAAGVPVMVRSDSHLKTVRSALKSALKFLPYRYFIQRLDGCLAVGTWSAEYFKHYGASEDRLFVVPHVADSDFYAAARTLRQKRRQLREQWGLGNERVFLFCGKFTDKKRPIDFVKAILAARERGVSAVGLMVGDGHLKHACVAEAGSEDGPIKYAGFLNQSKIAEAYVAADALVLPSDGGETWGLVVNEAMMCGLPCIVSDRVGCGPDLVTHKTGVTYPLGDVDALSRRIGEFASMDESTIHAYRDAATGHIAHWSAANAANAMVQAADSVLARCRH